MSGPRRILSLLCAAALVSVVAVQGGSATAATAWSATLIESVEALPVAVEVRTGYDRALFRHWVDADGDCQNARHEVLIAESSIDVTFTSATGCTVATGQWYSWYDGITATSASALDIDHVVALAEAWDSGAHSWTSAERQAFANDLGDPRSLVAVTSSINSSKSDRDPATWLPPLEQCRYVLDWTAVKIRWGLSVDTTEKARLAELAAGCPATTLAVQIARGDGPTPPTTTSTSTTTSSTTTTVAPTTTTTTPPTTTTTTPTRLVLSGSTRLVGTAKYADLSWAGPGTRFDLWRGGSRLLRGTTVRTHTDRVASSVTSATYTLCPAGTSRTSPLCSTITLRW